APHRGRSRPPFDHRGLRPERGNGAGRVQSAARDDGRSARAPRPTPRRGPGVPGRGRGRARHPGDPTPPPDDTFLTQGAARIDGDMSDLLRWYRSLPVGQRAVVTGVALIVGIVLLATLSRI